jgi:hypothetical protein
MSNVADLVAVGGWTVPFAESIVDVTNRVSSRWVLIDDSRSMTKLDGMRMVRDKGIQR